MTANARYTVSSAEHLIYDLGCSECGAHKGKPCTVAGSKLRRSWHVERITSAERHFRYVRYGHDHSLTCLCGL